MGVDASSLFELELVRRGVGYTRVDNFRYRLTAPAGTLDVEMTNLTRAVTAARDTTEEQALVAAWVDSILIAASTGAHSAGVEDLFWSLTLRGALPPSHPYVHPISPRLDRSLTATVHGGALLSHPTAHDLAAMAVDEQAAADAAFANLDAQLAMASVQTGAAGDTTLGWLVSDFPAKASLLLAPALRELIAPKLGWPLLAVAPTRDFLIMWPADKPELAPQLGRTVSREYHGSPHPLSTEVFRLDGRITAVGFLDV